MRNTDRRKKKKRRRIGDLIRLIGLFIALSVLLYPTISNYLYEKNSGRVITSYDEKAVQISESERKEMLEQARQYNEELLGNIELLDPFSPVKREVDKRYQSLLNVDGNGMMGYIRIPKIQVELPIYHGTEEKVLQSGVGHFEGTSLPEAAEYLRRRRRRPGALQISRRDYQEYSRIPAEIPGRTVQNYSADDKLPFKRANC